MDLSSIQILKFQDSGRGGSLVFEARNNTTTNSLVEDHVPYRKKKCNLNSTTRSLKVQSMIEWTSEPQPTQSTTNSSQGKRSFLSLATQLAKKEIQQGRPKTIVEALRAWKASIRGKK
jgi:hypothetical protein